MSGSQSPWLDDLKEVLKEANESTKGMDLNDKSDYIKEKYNWNCAGNIFLKVYFNNAFFLSYYFFSKKFFYILYFIFSKKAFFKLNSFFQKTFLTFSLFKNPAVQQGTSCKQH